MCLDVLCSCHFADEDLGTFQRDNKVLEALVGMPRIAAALESEGMAMQLLPSILSLCSQPAPGLV